VVDWITAPTEEHLVQLFGTEIEGLACLEFADEIVDSQGRDLRPRVQHLRLRAIQNNETLDPETSKSFTFCAFDPDFPTPISFVGIQAKESFVRKLLALRRDFFEIGTGQGFSTKVSQAADYSVGALIYEFWQNGIQHGRFDSQHQQMRGLRYLRLKKHVGGEFQRELFLSRAEGFAELRDYLDRATRGFAHYKFCEVTIGDSGIGIASRFLATRPEFCNLVQNPSDHPALVNRIIRESLSSKLNQAGAGHGLEQALGAVRVLKGFLSVRTGSSWLYHNSSGDGTEDSDRSLSVVHYSGRLASVGTQINLIYPLMDSGN
jgi:hypothetical protein